MEHYVGIDMPLQLSSLCVLNAANSIIHEAKVASEPEALVAFLRKLGLPIARVSLEAGPLSQWLHDGLREAGFDAVLLETRHVKTALSAMALRTDRQDARDVMQLLRVGWFRLVIASRCPHKRAGHCWPRASSCRSRPLTWSRLCTVCCAALRPPGWRAFPAGPEGRRAFPTEGRRHKLGQTAGAGARTNSRARHAGMHRRADTGRVPSNLMRF